MSFLKQIEEEDHKTIPFVKLLMWAVGKMKEKKKKPPWGQMPKAIMGIRYLKKTMPEWQWTAERNDFSIGWKYLGQRGNRDVEVQAYSIIEDAELDIYRTEWRVREKDDTTEYATWASRETKHFA